MRRSSVCIPVGSSRRARKLASRGVPTDMGTIEITERSTGDKFPCGPIGGVRPPAGIQRGAQAEGRTRPSAPSPVGTESRVRVN